MKFWNFTANFLRTSRVPVIGGGRQTSNGAIYMWSRIKRQIMGQSPVGSRGKCRSRCEDFVISCWTVFFTWFLQIIVSLLNWPILHFMIKAPNFAQMFISMVQLFLFIFVHCRNLFKKQGRTKYTVIIRDFVIFGFKVRKNSLTLFKKSKFVKICLAILGQWAHSTGYFGCSTATN